MPFDYSSVDMNAIFQRTYDIMSPEQRKGVGHGRKHGRHIYVATMGLGKTLEQLTVGLCFKPQVWMIICAGKNATGGWVGQIEQWYPEFSDPRLIQMVGGQAHKRQQQYRNREALFFITTGGSFLRDVEWLMSAGFRPSVITVDEPDRLGMRNRKSAFFKALKAFTAPSYTTALKCLEMCTGTFTSKGSPQAWSYLHVLDPKLFSSYWRYVEVYNHVVSGPFGRYVGAPRNTDGFAQAIAPYIYIVSKADAEKELPPMRRIPLIVEMDEAIRALYTSMEEQLYFEIDEGKLQSEATILAATIRMRQLVCCPKIIDPSLPIGSSIEAVCEKILEGDPDDPRRLHNLILSPFVPAIPHFVDYCSDTLNIPRNKILILKGGDESEYVREVETIFRRDPKTMVIGSLAFARSYELETGKAGYFPGFDWDPDMNSQAEGRIRRRTSEKGEMKLYYYVRMPETVTEDMWATLDLKVVTNKQTYSGVERLKERLKNSLGRP